MIPFYLTFAVAITYRSYVSSFIAIVMFIILSVAGYIVFRRSIKLKLVDWLSLCGAIILGFILSVF